MNAYILCGGESRRMGAPKATIPFQGIPMAIHIALLAQEAGFSPFLIAKPSQDFQFPFPILIDQEEKRHPLSGILRAMNHCPDPLFLILPCDTPLLTPNSLRQFLSSQGSAIAVNEHRHPLIGIYETGDKPRAQESLRQNLSMKRFSEDFHAVFFPPEELHNCNHPEDL